MTRSTFFVWIGSVVILLSAILGIVALRPPTSWLIIVSLALAGISAIPPILSAKYAASEQQKRDKELYDLTPKGRHEIARARLLTPMVKHHE
jgi:hypothetical protein